MKVNPNNFKVGDIVELIDNMNMNALAGARAKVYKINRFYVFVRWIPSYLVKAQADGGYYGYEFRLVTNYKPKKVNVKKYIKQMRDYNV